MLFDRVCNTVLESNEIKDDFELITPEKYSHAIVINYFRGHYELYEVEMASKVYAGNEDEIPFFDNKGIYEGPIPPEGYMKANITTGRDIMDLYNTFGDDNIIPGSYYIIKYPERPLEVATFIYSKAQGSGKNIILNFLQEFVFGNNITYYTTGLESILCNHNHLLRNKKIVIVDELASSSDNFVGNFDKFKSMMTGPTISINPKGVNQYNIKNVLSWFLISNHDDCIRIEATDRRYFCLSVSEHHIGNKEYFKQLADTFTQENGNIFYCYLIKRGDARDVNIRIPPMNSFKKSISGAT